MAHDRSIPNNNTDSIIENTTTMIVLSMSSVCVGQDTFLNSLVTLSKKLVIFSIIHFC